MADRDTILIPLPGEPVRSRPPKSVLADILDTYERHGLAAFLGPHLAQGVNNISQLLYYGLETVSPAADVAGMKDSVGRLSRSVREGDTLGAVTGSLDLLGSSLAMALPGTFAGYKRGVGTLVDAADEMMPRGGLLGAFEGRGGVAYRLFQWRAAECTGQHRKRRKRWR